MNVFGYELDKKAPLSMAPSVAQWPLAILRPRMHFPRKDTPRTANKVDFDSFFLWTFWSIYICKTFARAAKQELLRIFKETRNQEVERFCHRTERAPC